MLRVLLLSLCVIAFGCGGEPPSSEMLGSWYGTYSVDDGRFPVTGNGAVEVEIDAQSSTLSFGRICMDGSGRITTDASAKIASWLGDVACPWPPGPACSTSKLHYNKLDIILTDGGTLAALGVGHIAGCGYDLPVQISFFGRK